MCNVRSCYGENEKVFTVVFVLCIAADLSIALLRYVAVADLSIALLRYVAVADLSIALLRYVAVGCGLDFVVLSLPSAVL